MSKSLEELQREYEENTVKLDVPLIADGKILANWGEMKNDDIVSYPYRFNYGLVMGVL